MRLLEIQPSTQPLPASLTISVGDVLKLAASGGRVQSGTSVELVGAFVSGVVGTDGRALSPASSPNTVLFRAVAPGETTIDVFVGDPFRSSGGKQQTTLVVEA